MPSTIITRGPLQYPTQNKKALRLSNQELMYKMAMGNNWNKVRMGLMVALDGSLLSVSNGFRFAWGLCSGTVLGPSGIYSGKGVLNFVGLVNDLIAGGTAGNTLGYTAAASPNIDQFNVANIRAACYQGVTQIGTGTNIANPRWPATQDTAVRYRLPIIMDITKGTPSYTVRWWAVQANNQGGDVSDYMYNSLMMQASNTLSDVGSTNLATTQSDAFTCNETPGPFDSLCIWWSRTDQVLEIYRFDVARIS